MFLVLKSCISNDDLNQFSASFIDEFGKHFNNPYSSVSVVSVERVQDVVAVLEPKQEVLVEVVREPQVIVEIKPPQPRKVDDDWFVLLDVPAKTPGTALFHVWLLL